jgi:hypothetical protein
VTGPRRAVATLTLLATIVSMLVFAPAASAAGEHIYLMRVKVTTSANQQIVYFQSPTTFIFGRGEITKGAKRASTSSGSFGAGSLVLTRTRGRKPVSASFKVAITTPPSASFSLTSVKHGKGVSQIVVQNLNRKPARTIGRWSHRKKHHESRTLPIPTKKVVARGPARKTEPLSPRVLAFYYPWYSRSSWFGASVARYNRNERPYSSDEADAVQRHLSQARHARIDAFVSSWFGPDTQTDRNTKVLFDQLPGSGVKVALYFETLSEAFSSRKKVIGGLKYALDTYGEDPHYSTFHHRPLIYIYSPQHLYRSEGEPATPHYRRKWRSILRSLRSDGYRFATVASSLDRRDLRVFDGLHIYSARTSYTTTRRMSLESRAYASMFGGKRRLWGSPVVPGYDERHLPDRGGLHIPRARGAYYRSQWRSADEIRADQALILSFNEWYETTNIEPNRRWGKKYLDLTRAYSAAFRRGR